MTGSDVVKLVEDFGLHGLIAATFVGVVWVSAKPFFKFLTDDRENKRKHVKEMERIRIKAEAKKSKGGKS